MITYKCKENDMVVEYNESEKEFYFFSEGSSDKIIIGFEDMKIISAQLAFDLRRDFEMASATGSFRHTFKNYLRLNSPMFADWLKECVE